MKKIIFNLLFKKEIEELWDLRQKLSSDENTSIREWRSGIDICLKKLGATNTAWKYIRKEK